MEDSGVSAAFLVPFFGPLPPYFIHWVKSCEINHPRFHWFVYSDQVTVDRRLNRAVTVVPYAFEAMATDFRTILGLDIFRGNFRKICDYRILFYWLRRSKEPLDAYDFIGYTDVDMIYGELARFMPEGTRDYQMISADDGHPCGPFTLMRREAAAAVAEDPKVREEMTRPDYREFDESAAFMEIVGADGPVCCRAGQLQPAMSPGMDHRKTFSLWNRGRVTVWDRFGRRKQGGFHHFSRFKDKPCFRTRPEAIAHPAWGVCKYGILPLSSRRTHLRLGLSLFL